MQNTLRITVAAPAGTDPYRIDAATLNDELKAAGITFDGFHNAVEAIVQCDPADEAAVRALIQAHIDGTEKREANKVVFKQITALEAKVTQRMMRERGSRLTAIDEQIAALRGQLK